MRWFCTALFALPLAAALSEYQYLSTVNQFATSFLSPNNIEVVRSINSTLFAEDVTGTADLSTNFDGRELSTEYLFGLFVNNAEDPDDPSPFGIPISYNVTSLLVQHEFIAASIKFMFHYPILNKTYPIQIDAFIRVNEKGEIQQYDASFRRWAWATDVIIPELLPHMAQRLSLPVENTSLVLREYLSRKICNTAVTYCTGDDQQYDDYDSCMDFLNTKKTGEWYRMGEDNLVCRHLHVPMLSLRPTTHCPHIGPSGGDMCIDRDYEQVVLASHFPAGFLAPKQVTPENEKEVGHIQAASGYPLDPLLEIALSTGDMHSWDPTLYATALLGYFLIYYIFSHGLWQCFMRFTTKFRSLELEHQKNVVMYAMNIIFTTVALALQLAASPALGKHYRLWEVQCLRTGGVLVSALYIFELVYRLKMRLPLIAHHFLTIIAISFTVSVFEYTMSMSYMVSAIIWLFQATTEQPTFLGLMGYRLGWSRTWVARLLKFAAVQTFILKSASAIGLIVYWALHQKYNYRPIDVAWTCIVFIVAVGLLLTQAWGSYVTYAIGARIQQRHSILPTLLPDAASHYPKDRSADHRLVLNSAPSSDTLIGEAEPVSPSFSFGGKAKMLWNKTASLSSSEGSEGSASTGAAGCQ
ncbi:hypothetical protein L202_00488 [Cryptococcus amylolentus CBS 6039]|uniref:Intimal thickness related receptor IRP domain-containing protein n=1 Tax=Cryptococcus amylolentus CBS 6039 TaxID=1295533 RepID=A0A1E3I9X0_9TREE|nr:hypothetical protein L202_00488 [Cryptococcus amylolentus CBS 6039]ODN84561.1 hypothetical protein L202_00488 [Cryptococcus amylolentus CBS 6039]